MTDVENQIQEIKDSREAIDDLLIAMHRCYLTDDDTRTVENGLQGMIEREFKRIDQAVTDLEE